MDLKAEKLAIIEWLAGISDAKIISRFQALKRVSEEATTKKLSEAEIKGIDQGLTSIKEGKTKTNDEVIALTKAKFPQLYKTL